MDRSPLDRLAERWEADVERLREYGADAQARAVERCLESLEQAREERRFETLTLTEASEVSGYSYSRLQEMVGERIENVGEPGAPRVRRGDLPRKPGQSSAGPRAVEETESGEPDLAEARLELADG